MVFVFIPVDEPDINVWLLHQMIKSRSVCEKKSFEIKNEIESQSSATLILNWDLNSVTVLRYILAKFGRNEFSLGQHQNCVEFDF